MAFVDDALGRVVCVDTETTGLDPQESRIVQIACLELVDGEVPGSKFSSLVNPGVPIPADATSVHGITDAMVSGAPGFAEIAQEFLDFVGTSTLVIHNASFDLGVINSELRRIGRGPISNSVIDTMRLMRIHIPGIRASLDSGCRHFGISLERRRERHDALVDVELLAQLYGRLRNMLVRKATMAQEDVLPDGSHSPLPDRGIGGPSVEERERHVVWRRGLGLCVCLVFPLAFFGCSLPRDVPPHGVASVSSDGPSDVRDGSPGFREEDRKRVVILDGNKEIDASDRVLVRPDGDSRRASVGISQTSVERPADRRGDDASRPPVGQAQDGSRAVLSSDRQSRDIVDPATLAVLSYLLGTQPMPAAMMGVRLLDSSVSTGVSPALRLLRE